MRLLLSVFLTFFFFSHPIFSQSEKPQTIIVPSGSLGNISEVRKKILEKTLESALDDHFDIVSIDRDHIFPYQIEPYKNGEYIKQPWFESMPDNMFKVLEKKLGWHLLITAKLK